MTVPTTKIQPKSGEERDRLDLFILIDALGWEYIKDRPFLNDLLPYRRPLQTVLGFSSGAIPTILTGAWPSVTGHWNLFYYDPQGSPFRWLKYFQFVPNAIMNHRVSSKLLKELGRHFLGLGPLFDCCVRPSLLRWFNWVERKNIYSYGGISGAPSIFDELKERQIKHKIYTYHDYKDAEIVDRAQVDVRESDATFFFLYLSEMDMFLHENCTDDRKLDETIAWYDRQIRRIYDSARQISKSVSVTIFSDHGMTPVTNQYDLMRDIEQTGSRPPKDYLAVYDSTMARFWFFNSEARLAIESVLRNAPCGQILPEAELKRMGVYFEDQRFGELIFLMNPGWMLAKSDFNGSQWTPSGMHGYHPSDKYSDGVFLSSQMPPREVNNLTDVYGCMRKGIL
jgi:predicted AlkP superfamily pyrophosphatase or phosphodiesterase